MNSGKICRISQWFCYFEKYFQCQSQWAVPFPLYGLNEHLILHFLLWLRCRKLELNSCVSWELVQVNFKGLFLNYPLFSLISFRLENHMLLKKKKNRTKIDKINRKIFRLNEFCFRFLWDWILCRYFERHIKFNFLLSVKKYSRTRKFFLTLY